MTDWREFDTTTIQGREQLNRLIAECVGWKPEQFGGLWHWRNGEQKWGVPDSQALTPDAAWKYSYRLWHLPHYCEDVDNALSLIEPHTAFRLDRHMDVWRAEFFHRTSTDEVDHVWEDHASAAIAICKAWLAYTSGMEVNS